MPIEPTPDAAIALYSAFSVVVACLIGLAVIHLREQRYQRQRRAQRHRRLLAIRANHLRPIYIYRARDARGRFISASR